MTICHNGNTLELPLKAAIAHLANHSEDTVGECSGKVIEKEKVKK